mmetsp:Transcript_8986/g.14631  ORF Transcript_8986/g.14631 Transcript_8986/m.14631 type:complete len:126 (+) Transcript_8986:368-745(+)
MKVFGRLLVLCFAPVMLEGAAIHHQNLRNQQDAPSLVETARKQDLPPSSPSRLLVNFPGSQFPNHGSPPVQSRLLKSSSKQDTIVVSPSRLLQEFPIQQQKESPPSSQPRLLAGNSRRERLGKYF